VHKQQRMIITKLNFKYEDSLLLVQQSVFRQIIQNLQLTVILFSDMPAKGILEIGKRRAKFSR